MSVADPVSRVAFIGLGRMGGHMCRNVITAGFAVSAFDLDGEAEHLEKEDSYQDGEVAIAAENGFHGDSF